MTKPRMCIVCKARPAEVPDRNKPGRCLPLKVCRHCHGERLRGDLTAVLQANQKVKP